MPGKQGITPVLRVAGMLGGMALLFVLLGTCATTEKRFQPSGANGGFEAPPGSYADYVESTRGKIAAHRIFFRPQARDVEIDANTPYELRPEPGQCPETAGAFLLLHGLSDSPYVMRDLANALRERCYLVRAILFPGHGTRAADMLHISYDDWLAAARFEFSRLRREFGEVGIGGFSMGATVAMLMGVEDEGVSHLILLAPAISTQSRMLFLAPWLRGVKRWVDTDPIEEVARYEALSTNAAAEYYLLTRHLLGQLDDGASFSMPVFIAMSADDSVIDTGVMERAFREKMNSPKSRLVIFRRQTEAHATETGGRVHYWNSNLPEQRILGFSHLSIPFAPDNEYYGRNAPAFCHDFTDDPRRRARCETAKEIWYRGYRMEDDETRVFTRLTFNPHFDGMIEEMDAAFAIGRKGAETAACGAEALTVCGAAGQTRSGAVE